MKDSNENAHQNSNWAVLLENSFQPLPVEQELDYDVDDNYQINILNLDEVKLCVKHLKSEKSPVPDTKPVEQFKNSSMACEELYKQMRKMWKNVDVPEDLVMVTTTMLYKKKIKNDHSN